MRSAKPNKGNYNTTKEEHTSKQNSRITSHPITKLLNF
jgi:hypothetical protein